MADAAEKQIDEQVDENEQVEGADEASLEEIPLALKPVGRNRFGLAVEKENHYRVDVSKEVTPEMLLDPKFWEHISQFLRATDVITVIREDMAWKAVLFVRDCGHNWAHVAKEQFFDYGGGVTPQDPLPARYSIDFAGTHNKWRVKLDKDVLKDGFASKEMAQRFAHNHALALKR